MSAGTANDPVLTGPETRDGAKTGAGMTEEARIMAAFLDATVECLDDPHPRGWVTTFLRLPADMWDEVHDRLTPEQRSALDREIEAIDKNLREPTPMTFNQFYDRARLRVDRISDTRIRLNVDGSDGVPAAVDVNREQARDLAAALTKWADGQPAPRHEPDPTSFAVAVGQARDRLIAEAASLAMSEDFDANEIVMVIGAAADRLIAAARKQGQ